MADASAPEGHAAPAVAGQNEEVDGARDNDQDSMANVAKQDSTTELVKVDLNRCTTRKSEYEKEEVLDEEDEKDLPREEAADDELAEEAPAKGEHDKVALKERDKELEQAKVDCHDAMRAALNERERELDQAKRHCHTALNDALKEQEKELEQAKMDCHGAVEAALKDELDPKAATPAPGTQLGRYRVVSAGPLEQLPVSAEISRTSPELARLPVGSEVEVVEIAEQLDGGRRRARIENASSGGGWITLVNTTTGTVFAERISDQEADKRRAASKEERAAAERAAELAERRAVAERARLAEEEARAAERERLAAEEEQQQEARAAEESRAEASNVDDMAVERAKADEKPSEQLSPDVQEEPAAQEEVPQLEPLTQPELAPQSEPLPVGQIIADMTRYTGQALTCRRKDQIGHSVKQMERALATCQGREQAHPALAVEAARARLNLGAMLSRAGQHLEALVAVKEAQRGLSSVLAWAEDCGPGDPGVDPIAEEARALQCAALLAEAIELEPVAQEGAIGPDWSTRPPKEVAGRHEQIYAQANKLAQGQLPPSHPVASVAQRLYRACEKEKQKNTVVLPPLDQSGGRGQEGGMAQQQSGYPRYALAPQENHGVAPGADVSAAQGQRVASSGSARNQDGGAVKIAKDEVANEPVRVGKQQKGAPDRLKATANRSHAHHRVQQGERHDVFTDFLRHAEAEKEARRGGLYDSQEDDRKRLDQKHKSTRLILELSNDNDLRDKRYTNNGHKVVMGNLLRENKSRSEPNLLKEARRNGESPEVHSLKKISRFLDAKPSAKPMIVAEAFKQDAGE